MDFNDIDAFSRALFFYNMGGVFYSIIFKAFQPHYGPGVNSAANRNE